MAPELFQAKPFDCSVDIYGARHRRGCMSRVSASLRRAPAVPSFAHPRIAPQRSGCCSTRCSRARCRGTATSPSTSRIKWWRATGRTSARLCRRPRKAYSGDSGIRQQRVGPRHRMLRRRYMRLKMACRAGEAPDTGLSEIPLIPSRHFDWVRPCERPKLADVQSYPYPLSSLQSGSAARARAVPRVRHCAPRARFPRHPVSSIVALSPPCRRSRYAHGANELLTRYICRRI